MLLVEALCFRKGLQEGHRASLVCLFDAPFDHHGTSAVLAERFTSDDTEQYCAALAIYPMGTSQNAYSSNARCPATPSERPNTHRRT